MSDCDEGDVPFRGRVCPCGLMAPHEDDAAGWLFANGACPDCKRVWPEKLIVRYPHDGGPAIRPFVYVRSAPSAVDHPPHYGGADDPYETIKVIEAWQLDFSLGNAVKYISRAGKKDPTKLVEDLKKAAWYLGRAIQNAERAK